MFAHIMRKRKTNIAYILFILPAFSLFTLFFIIPFFRSVYYSFTDLYGYNTIINFIGLRHYIDVFKDSNFYDTLTVTVKYTLFVAILGNIFSLLMAFVLDTGIEGRNILRTIFFIPNVMSLIIVGFVWTFIYGDVYRSLTGILGSPGLLQISWLGNPLLSIFSIGITAIWQSAGYAMIIYIAGLQNISPDIIDAADIDGATSSAILFRIKLPLISPVIVMNLILAMTSGLKVFDFPWSMTSGGPGYATTSLALYIYIIGFKTQRFGYATAISVILCLMIAVITIFLMKFLKKREVGM